jgi:hypothetical protein
VTLPNFIIIGAYKSGTTSLYHYLRQHPEIFMSRIKEPNFFAHEKITELMRQAERVPNAIDNMDTYLELFSKVSNEKAIGEASPLYLGSTIAAQRIKEAIPDVKLIAILRHPVEAFYSDHHMRIRDGRKVEGDFQKRFKEVENRIRSGEISGLMYYAQLKVYYDLFDSLKIRIYLFEDLINNSKALMQDIFRFLGVDDTFFPDTSEMHNVGGIPKIHKLNELLKRILKRRKIQKTPFLRNVLLTLQRVNMTQIPPLSSELKSELTDILREDIQNLGKLINRDLSSWLS